MKKKITNYENYNIYDNGDVENVLTHKILQGSISENGYKYYRLSKDNAKHKFYAHRLVAEAFIPNPNGLPVVNHKDGNKLNNNVDNLEWVTYSENIAHAHKNELITKRSITEYYEGDLDGEEWKQYQDYDNYLISNKGRIRNVKTNRILKPSVTSGYYKVRLSKNGQVVDLLVHKLVYALFNNEEYLKGREYIIDHIDANKLNNDIFNLRKVTNSENTIAALYEQKVNNSAKAVAQYSLDLELLNTFPSAAEAARQLHLDSSTISKVCRGVNKTHGGFIFKYI
jgi:hypothetical protein